MSVQACNKNGVPYLLVVCDHTY